MGWLGQGLSVQFLTLLLVSAGCAGAGIHGSPDGSCIPTSCAAAGKNCGTISDGCGAMLGCGTCVPPQTCGGGGTANVCGAGMCTPTTCAAQSKNCGSISDGCSEVLDCGSCSPPETCGGGGTANVCGRPQSDITVTPRAVGLTTTQRQQFQATMQASSVPVTWSVDGVVGGNASVGSISSAGLYAPPNAAGRHNVTATSIADPSKSGTASVAVTDYPGTFTFHNDNQRTGQNLRELALTPAVVNQDRFGKLFSCPIDGYAYAQPLYVANVSIGGGFRNVVYVATEHNTLYAFDADANPCIEVWPHQTLGGSVPPVDTGETGDVVPEIGITSTPVIDPETGTLYVAAKTKEAGPTYVHRLHAIDIATGAEKFGGPVELAAAGFDPLPHLQRPALLLNGGTVYVAFGSHGDNNSWHGWVFGYNAITLAQIFAWSSTNLGSNSQGAIWQSGNGPAADSDGNIYLETGNGDFDPSVGSYGDSVIKLSPTGAVLDYFTPYNEADLNAADIDLGSGGPIVLPDQTGPTPHLVLATGKTGILYVLDRDNMGQKGAVADDQIVQSVGVQPNLTDTGGMFGQPAYWNGNLYAVAIDDYAKAFTLLDGTVSDVPISQSATPFAYPGATPAVSAFGASNGVVWALEGNGYSPSASVSVVLHAYDANDLATELYNSSLAGPRDAAGAAVKFAVPTVANGKVYVGTQAELTVYGLLP
ncbi:MAG TPA: pyrrolo-quinoline quinone [Polyangia bacterium]|nr:pyrrolo-quinoline quinone [Polyangia bacterium]